MLLIPCPILSLVFIPLSHRSFPPTLIHKPNEPKRSRKTTKQVDTFRHSLPDLAFLPAIWPLTSLLLPPWPPPSRPFVSSSVTVVVKKLWIADVASGLLWLRRRPWQCHLVDFVLALVMLFLHYFCIYVLSIYFYFFINSVVLFSFNCKFL